MKIKYNVKGNSWLIMGETPFEREIIKQSYKSTKGLEVIFNEINPSITLKPVKRSIDHELSDIH